MLHSITLKPSLYARSFLLISHFSALIALGISAYQGWGFLPFVFLALLAAANLALAWRALHALCHVSFRLAPDGSLVLQNQNGEWVEARVLHDALVWPWLVAARVKCDGKVWRLIALPDNLPGEDFRALRVWVRHTALV